MATVSARQVATQVVAPSKTIVLDESLVPELNPATVFDCPMESLFYSQCLQKVCRSMPPSRDGSPPVIVEFGAGDGSPVIDALLKVGRSFNGHVHGFELNPVAASIARTRAAQLGLSDKYKVHHSCFFKGAEALRSQHGQWLVANPPYIPAPDNDILMPELHGGVDGATLTNNLLGLGYPNAMLLVSSYSNPLSTIAHARKLGYSVTDFLITPLPFGHYSSEPKVKNWIRKMKSQDQAFFTERPTGAKSTTGASNGWYLLAGVLFQKQPATSSDGSDYGVPQEPYADAFEELISVLTALQ